MNVNRVTIEVHGEYWFIVPHHAEGAAAFHKELEGYDSADATAEMIPGIPDSITPDVGRPLNGVPQACGAGIRALGEGRPNESRDKLLLISLDSRAA